jgi:hypothetical protein
VRPLLAHESAAGIFESVVAAHPVVSVLEAKFDVRGNPRTALSRFDADFVFGPQHTNDEVSDHFEKWSKKNTYRIEPWDRCYDFLNIFAEKNWRKNGVFDSKQS